MEIVLIGLAVLIAAGAVTALVTTYRARGLRAGGGAVGAGAQSAVEPATRKATATSPRDASARARDEAFVDESGGDGAAGPSTADLREQLDLELVQRRAELGRIEERLLGKEQSTDVRLAELERREQALEDRERNLEQTQEKLKTARREQVRELERIAGLTAGQAKQILLRELEDELEHESARMIRQSEEDAKREADRRARSILATSMQRLAAGHAAETTVSVVQLRSDDLKGRIIGREGRNIRSLETLTGIDF
ncbi:MAG TPA: Rnase Y domain-containing protein, partial [Thermoleophilaceae bacterium]|nr:Rnase Y domain-containing protein [Thermoleophilaceae bacterium]